MASNWFRKRSTIPRGISHLSPRKLRPAAAVGNHMGTRKQTWLPRVGGPMGVMGVIRPDDDSSRLEIGVLLARVDELDSDSKPIQCQGLEVLPMERWPQSLKLMADTEASDDLGVAHASLCGGGSKGSSKTSWR